MIQFYGELSIYLLAERLLAAGQNTKCGKRGKCFSVVVEIWQRVLDFISLGSSSMETVCLTNRLMRGPGQTRPGKQGECVM